MLGIGTDIVEVQRIVEVWQRQGEKLVQRVLTPAEQNQLEGLTHDDAKARFLAKRWCAKEAIAKALGTGIAKGIGWQQMEIAHDELGKPVVLLTGAAKDRLLSMNAETVLISISDERHYVVAFSTIS